MKTQRWAGVWFVYAWLLPIGEAAAAEAPVLVSRVELQLSRGPSSAVTGGKLYRTGSVKRDFVASVSKDGKTSKPVQCGSEDQFEAESEDGDVTYAVAPVRIPCSAILVFRFKTILFGTADLPWLRPSMATRPAVLQDYSAIFAAAGEGQAADALRDASVASVARILGDESLARYVYRDPARGDRLVLNAQGTEALKVKQLFLKIKPTGQIDPVTRRSLATSRLAIDETAVIPASDCVKTGSDIFFCSPISASEPKNGAFNLPKLTYEKKAQAAPS